MENFAAIQLIGNDASDFGQRMFSRNLKDIPLNSAKLSLFLTAEGKVSALFWLLKKEDGLLLLTPFSRATALYELIERYHFTETFKATLIGEKSSSWKAGQSFADGEGKIEQNIFVGTWRGTDFRIDLNDSKSAEPKTESSDWNIHRIQNLIPEFSKDYSESALVFDLGFESLCDQNKGCYIGQEVVERVRTHGGTGPRRLASFEFAKLPQAEEILMDSESKQLGQLTKSQSQISANKFISLGYLKRGVDVKSTFTAADSKISGKNLRVI
ncbi:MAG: hypothetical protein J0L93_06490 [Deltaproteobacteria bacterium]|nr:hypothetical protein [Deltaproteobacteria bacterium]